MPKNLLYKGSVSFNCLSICLTNVWEASLLLLLLFRQQFILLFYGIVCRPCISCIEAIRWYRICGTCFPRLGGSRRQCQLESGRLFGNMVETRMRLQAGGRTQCRRSLKRKGENAGVSCSAVGCWRREWRESLMRNLWWCLRRATACLFVFLGCVIPYSYVDRGFKKGKTRYRYTCWGEARRMSDKCGDVYSSFSEAMDERMNFSLRIHSTA